MLGVKAIIYGPGVPFVSKFITGRYLENTQVGIYKSSGRLYKSQSQWIFDMNYKIIILEMLGTYNYESS